MTASLTTRNGRITYAEAYTIAGAANEKAPYGGRLRYPAINLYHLSTRVPHGPDRLAGRSMGGGAHRPAHRSRSSTVPCSQAASEIGCAATSNAEQLLRAGPVPLGRAPRSGHVLRRRRSANELASSFKEGLSLSAPDPGRRYRYCRFSAGSKGKPDIARTGDDFLV